MLYAQIKEARPAFAAYRDSWYMNTDLEASIGSYIFTLLTGDCNVGTEPGGPNSAAWLTWYVKQVGYQTAMTLTTLLGDVPGCSN